MSSSDPLETLRVEASCSVCLGYLRDPVLLECGHNFCRSCITRWWAELSRDFPCPVCRKTSRRRALRPNRQLANMVEAARQLRGPKRKASPENPEICCQIHGRALVRFCREDQAPACRLCGISSAHRAHQMVPLEEAAREYKELLRPPEKRPRRGAGRWVFSWKPGRKRSGKPHPRSEKEEEAEAFSGFWGAVDPLCSRFFPTPPLFPFPVDVTLDPTTAGPEVILSEDLKEATWGRPGRRWPQGPGRFDTDPCMLGSQGFTSGRHYWEVEASGRFWTVGVARESVRREGRILFKPNAEIWGLQKYDELCVALTAPSNTFVPLRSGEIGVYLDYEVGQVSFYALGTRCCVFTFRVASFSGERVFPYFCVLLSTIKLPPRA
uniref:Uncharacterized protein n=1 Tax=Anas zonorhyncha TaxID=75864 RepID=A0A8B9V8Y2_9AVES